MGTTELSAFCAGLEVALNKGDHQWKCTRVEVFSNQTHAEALITAGGKSTVIAIRAGPDVYIANATHQCNRQVQMSDIAPMAAEIKRAVDIWSAKQMAAA